jgi:hypothetical protein
MDFLLPKAQLKGLSEEEQKTVKDEAFNQFLLGSIFGGKGIASGYQAVQNIIPNLQNQKQQQGLLQDLQGMKSQFFPNEQEAQGQALNANLGRRRTAPSPYSLGTTLGIPQERIEPQSIAGDGPNYADMQTQLARLALNPAASSMIPALSSSFGAFKPNITDGVATDIRGRPTSVIPRMDTKTGMQFGGNVQNGNVNFTATDIPGFADATARNAVPPLAPYTRFTFDDFGRRTGVTNDLGAIPALTERTLAEKRAEGKARLETTPTNVYDTGTGRTRRTTEQEALAAGGVTALSPSEIQAYEGYKPIRDAAFLGAESAKASDISLQNLQNILNRGNFKPGKFAVAQSEIASIATGLGIGGERAKLMSTDSALTVQAVSDITASRIKEMGSAISNADVTFSAGRGPQISNQEEAMQFYIDLNGVVNKRKKDYFNYVAKNPVPDVAEKWSQTSQGTSSVYEDPKLRKYLPKFPVKQGPDKGKTAYQLPSGDIVLFD